MARRPKASAAQQLFYEALVMEDSAAKLATLLEAARHADAEGDTDLGFLIRNEVLSAGLMCGAGREMLVNYAWCLARADAEPDRFPLEDVLFQYRWVIFEAAELLEITRDQVHELLADITRRYQAYGISLRSVYVLQRACALELGDVALATLSHAKWRRARIDFWSDHESIESIFLVSYFLFKGQLSRALQAAQSHLNGCETDPHSLTCAFGELVLPVALRGDLELARTLAARMPALLRREPRHFDLAGNVLAFFALDQQFDAALRLLKVRIGTGLTLAPGSSKLRFLRGVLVLLAEWEEQRGKRPLRLSLPAHLPHHRPDGLYPAAELIEPIRRDLHVLTRAFDRRNGNTYYADVWQTFEQQWRAWKRRAARRRT